MRHGKGVLISNGAAGPSAGAFPTAINGCYFNYEGRFKEDRKHGKGILKVIMHHDRFSIRQKEVKVYE
jgi:hypothetical protein